MNITPNRSSRKEKQMNAGTRTTFVAGLVALGLALTARAVEPAGPEAQRPAPSDRVVLTVPRAVDGKHDVTVVFYRRGETLHNGYALVPAFGGDMAWPAVAHRAGVLYAGLKGGVYALEAAPGTWQCDDHRKRQIAAKAVPGGYTAIEEKGIQCPERKR